MPSLGIHLLVADSAFARLGSSKDSDVRSLAPVVGAFPEMASLGAIGPDLLYYLNGGPKIAAAVADVFHFLNRLTGVFGDLATIAQQGGMPNVANRIQQLGDMATLAVGTSQAGLLKSAVDLYQTITGSHLFKPSEQQDEQQEKDWNWGDLLHDRISGTFATTLLTKARRSADGPLLAYATGYMTHLATDFVGHPYVNTVVGGPARGWNMRHTLAEKFMDASVFQRKKLDINTSKLHTRFSSLADSDQLHGFCGTLAGAIEELGHDLSIGYRLKPACKDEEIRSAFDAMCTLFRMVTESACVAPPKAPRIVIPPIPGKYGTLTHAVAGMLPPGRPRTMSDWLRALLALLAGAPALIADMTRFVIDCAAGVAGYTLAAGLFVFQSYLYSLYRQVRWFLVISGVLFPCNDELGTPFARQFTESRGPNDDNYPHVPPDVSEWTHKVTDRIVFVANNFDYLNYPATPGEVPSAKPSLYPAGTTPELFMFDLQRDDQFVAAWLAAATPSEVRKLVIAIPPLKPPYQGGFGNAADLSILLLSRPDIAAKINLDSDRGYGYRQWRCSGGFKTGKIANEVFI